MDIYIFLENGNNYVYFHFPKWNYLISISTFHFIIQGHFCQIIFSVLRVQILTTLPSL